MGVLGGMPYYLQVFNDGQDLLTNIRKHILDASTGVLFSEPRLLLMEELREPRNYFSILRVIAQGRTRLNEIAQASGVGSGNTVARYLDILQQMRLITRRTPATESQPEKSKKGLYQIQDHFFRFWFRYVHPNQSALDLGLADAILKKLIQPDLDAFLAAAFEQAAQVHLAKLAQTGALPFLPERVGGWWDRNSEIDVLAVSESERAILVGECKWSIRPVGVNVLDQLKEKAQVLARGEKWSRIEYALFARTGFTAELQRRAVAEGVRLVRLEEMLSLGTE
jgi:AAA+ ATPase superfamily predicted ATPase